jgi:hypothetical protein
MVVKENFSLDELNYIQHKYDVESKAYLFIMRLVMIAGIFLGTAIWLIEIWHNAHATKAKDITHVAPSAFATIVLLIVLIGVCAYLFTVRPLYLDATQRMKCIETFPIISKESIENFGLYKVFITNKYKSMIEVSAQDYKQFEIGDEINIEYAAHSKEFFNYF